MCLDINKVCFDEEQDIANTLEKSRKSQALLNGVDVGNVEYWTQALNALVATKLNLWDTFKYCT